MQLGSAADKARRVLLVNFGVGSNLEDILLPREVTIENVPSVDMLTDSTHYQVHGPE